MEILFRRNLYTIALDVADESGGTPEGRAEIRRLYGDNLYSCLSLKHTNLIGKEITMVPWTNIC